MQQKLTEPQLRERAAKFCTTERQIKRSAGRGWPRPCPYGGCSECRGLVQIEILAQETASEIVGCFNRQSPTPSPDTMGANRG